jgi:hypothetical protein
LARFGAVGAGALLIMSIVAAPAYAGTTASTLAKASKYPFAGYITPPATATSVAATVTLPSFACTKKMTAVAAIATVYDPTGAKFSGAEVYLACSRRKETLGALADIDNAFTILNVTMASGDTVALSATCGPSGISITVDDETTSSIGTDSSSSAETCTQAEAGDDGVAKGTGSAVVPLPPFGALDYMDVMVNGSAIGSSSPGAANYNEGKKNVITTGALTGGNAFTTTKES